jgi:hypothetical protein
VSVHARGFSHHAGAKDAKVHEGGTARRGLGVRIDVVMTVFARSKKRHVAGVWNRTVSLEDSGAKAQKKA